MKRQTTKMENKLDENYRREADWLHALVLRLARKHINRVVKIVLSRAYERSQIDSWTMHEMGGICDRILWPERHTPANGVVMQQNNVCGGDMAGGDINK
jgi:hypothetical protein